MEVIVAPTYSNQSKVDDIFKIFESNNFKLYGIYDIEKKPKRGKIQQFDALFYNGILDLWEQLYNIKKKFWKKIYMLES